MTQKNTARHRFLIPSKTNITVYPSAVSAHNVWRKFHSKKSFTCMSNVDKYFKPAIKVIFDSDKKKYLYFDNFERMSHILQYESKLSQSFIIIESNDQQTTKMAWTEVLDLCFYRNVNHVLLWQHLKKYCAQSILKELMGCDSLRIQDYCYFAGIDSDQYEYQRGAILAQQKKTGLPPASEWLDE